MNFLFNRLSCKCRWELLFSCTHASWLTCLLHWESFTQGRRSLKEGALSHAEGLGFLMGCNSALGRTATSSFGSSPSTPWRVWSAWSLLMTLEWTRPGLIKMVFLRSSWKRSSREYLTRHSICSRYLRGVSMGSTIAHFKMTNEKRRTGLARYKAFNLCHFCRQPVGTRDSTLRPHLIFMRITCSSSNLWARCWERLYMR